MGRSAVLQGVRIIRFEDVYERFGGGVVGREPLGYYNF